MKEWEQAVLEQYDINVKDMKKVRGGVLCDSEEGFFLLAETKLSEKRLDAVAEVQNHLIEHDFCEIDCIQRNCEGKLLCELEDGTKYFLKKWFNGRECDVKKENELLNAIKNMARLHNTFRVPVTWKEEGTILRQGVDLRDKFLRHNRELKKVRSFIRGKVSKGEFENAFLQNFERVYVWAEAALEQLKETECESSEKYMIHGDYNYHNILMLHEGMATTNFEHVEENIQVTDFYYFLRKAMEKHHWDVRLGEKMLDYYQRFLPLSEGEIRYLTILIAYPEKFWKAANSYSRAKKTWIPAKNLEKLELVAQQMEEKRIFLEKVFDFRL